MPSKRRRARRDRENSGGPSPAWMGSVVLLGLVAVVLVIVLIHAAISSPTPAAPAVASPGASPGAVPPAGIATAPGGVPATANAGQEGRPAGCTSSAGIAYCYSHTPLGALLAASNLGHGAGTDAAIQNSVLDHSVVPNQYAQQLAAEPGSSDSGAGAGIQLGGFRIISYSSDQASISLALSVPGRTDTYPQLSVAMRWYQGDWRAVPQAGPALFVAAASAPSLAGFVPWAGVS